MGIAWIMPFSPLMPDVLSVETFWKKDIQTRR